MSNRFCFFATALMILLGVSNKSFSITAYPYGVTITTENGKQVVIYLRGDEYLKYAFSKDGYTLINDSSGWWYAEKNGEEGIKKSAYRLMAAEDETEALKAFKKSCPKEIISKQLQATNKVNYTFGNGRRTNANGTITGERRALVILMEFNDLAFKKSQKDFDALFNSTNYHLNDATGSVRDYYNYASQGQLDYVSDVYGPYTAQYNMRYYGANSSNGGSDSNPVALCIEAVKNLPSDLDYTIYDNDGDGMVDNVHIIYAGYGEEAGASADAIWAHEYPHRIALKSEVGYSLAGYSCSPELRANRGLDITHIGVICHELGHALGAMDYYDTNYGTGGEYDGTGQWDIMASGSWNDNGRTPPNFNPYVRSEVFGWNKQEVLELNQNITMPRMDVDNAEQTVVYRLNTGSNDDYFLLENRQQHKFDAALPGAGLMVYHVHPNIEKYKRTNTINASHPQGLFPVCAAYSEPKKKKYGNINSTDCPFPGRIGMRSFSSTTSPAAVAWDGSAATVSLSSITMNPMSGTITFTIGESSISEPDEPDIPTEQNLVYDERFENNMKGRMVVSSSTGKEKWQTYTRGNFVMNADFIPEPTEGTHLFMLFSGKNASLCESEAVSTEIDVEAGENYTLYFDVYCAPIHPSLVPTFNLFVEDEYGEHHIYSLNETTNEWNTVEIPLVFAGNHFHYKLHGSIYAGGIFIDNIRLYKEETASPIKSSMMTGLDSSVYHLDGTYVGRIRSNRHVLLPDIYIMKQEGRTIKFMR